MAKNKKLKRSLIEWGIIIGVAGILYFTGLHTQVIGTLQGLVLKTGIIRPDISGEDKPEKADYRFILTDRNGKPVSGKDLEGKVVFMNFWATWCPPCIAEMPDIHDLYTAFKSDDQVVFLLVSLDDDFQKAVRFVDKKEFDFPIYRFASAIPDVYSSRVIPTTYVLSPEGTIAVRKEGMAKYDTRSFREFLRELKD